MEKIGNFVDAYYWYILSVPAVLCFIWGLLRHLFNCLMPKICLMCGKSPAWKVKMPGSTEHYCGGCFESRRSYFEWATENQGVGIYFLGEENEDEQKDEDEDENED